MAIKHMKHLECNLNNQNGHRGQVVASKDVKLTTCPGDEKMKHFKLGYQEAMSEAIRFMVEFEGLFAGDGLCLRMVNHLHKHIDSLDQDAGGHGRQGGDVKPFINDNRTSKPMDIEENDHCVESSSEHLEVKMNGHPNGSQLRKMLEAKEGSLNVTPKGQVAVSPAPASPSIYSEGSRKNYKKEIKDRFQATMSSSNSASNSNSSSSPVTSHLKVKGHENVGAGCQLAVNQNQFSSADGTLSPLPAYKSSPCFESLDHKENHHAGGKVGDIADVDVIPSGCQLVPGFALHPTGSFYVPVRLEPLTVSRFMAADAQSGPYPVLHPINIAVSFANSAALYWPPVQAQSPRSPVVGLPLPMGSLNANQRSGQVAFG